MVNLVDRQAGHVLGRLEARTDGRTRLPSIRDLSDFRIGHRSTGGGTPGGIESQVNTVNCFANERIDQQIRGCL